MLAIFPKGSTVFRFKKIEELESHFRLGISEYFVFVSNHETFLDEQNERESWMELIRSS